LYATLTGVGGAAGALYAGYSWTLLGPNWTFALASLAALAAAVIMARHMATDRRRAVAVILPK
jgi:PPP family 3-phenylpropionic acid transporter